MQVIARFFCKRGSLRLFLRKKKSPEGLFPSTGCCSLTASNSSCGFCTYANYLSIFSVEVLKI